MEKDWDYFFESLFLRVVYVIEVVLSFVGLALLIIFIVVFIILVFAQIKLKVLISFTKPRDRRWTSIILVYDMQSHRLFKDCDMQNMLSLT